MATEFLVFAGSLKHQVILYVVGHIDEFSIESLSLLPVAVKREILLTGPVVDVQRLESTAFMDSMDLNDVWKGVYELRIPKNMQTALTELLKRPEIEHAALDLSWKEKFILCCFDAATSSKFYRHGSNKVVYLFELILFTVSKSDFPSFKCLPQTFKSLFNLRSIKLSNTSLPPFISRPCNDTLYTSMLTPMPTPPAQSQAQTPIPPQIVENFVNIIEAMKLLQNFFNFRPRILLLHNVTILDVTQNVLWPTAHISGFTSANAIKAITEFLQDVQIVCMRSRGWNPAKNLSILRTIFQVLVSNRNKMLSGIVLDILNIGIPAQNQVLAAISSTLTGLLLIPNQAHARAARQAPYDTLTIFSVCLSIETPEEMKHINSIIRSQLQLEVAKVNCNNKVVVFDPKPFDVEVYSSLFESTTMLVFMNPALQHLDISQVLISSPFLQNLLYHFLTSTSTTDQLLCLSCVGIVHSPLKSKVSVCKSETALDAGKHGPRSLKLYMCHFSQEMHTWLCGFPKIKLKSLQLISTNVTDRLSAMEVFSKLENLEVETISLSLVSCQDLWPIVTALLVQVTTTSSKTTLKSNLHLRNVTKEHLPSLIHVLKATQRKFNVLNFVFSSSAMRDNALFDSLLEVVFNLPYLNDLALTLVSPALRKNHLERIIQKWSSVVTGDRKTLKTLSISGDSTVDSSNLVPELKDRLFSMAGHFCHLDHCSSCAHASI